MAGPPVVERKESEILARAMDRVPGRLSDAVSSVLSFYGSQVTSHAAIAVGFFVAFFAVIQVRTTLGPTIFFLAVATVVFGAIYSGLRLIYWSTLSTALMHGYVERLEKFAESVSQKQMTRIPHAFVNEYALAYLRNAENLREVDALRLRAGFYRWKIVPFAVSTLLALMVAYIFVNAGTIGEIVRNFLARVF